MWQSSDTIPQDTLHHIALCCLEGSTMSNLVHRRRRCARIVSYMILLPGGQYVEGWILFLPRIERNERIYVLSGGKNRSKSLLRSPGLTPLQPDVYAQPRKRASLPDPPHPSGLPIGRRESHKTKKLPLAVQNEPPAEATDDYLRPARSLSS